MIKVLALLLGCFALASSTKHRRVRHGERVTQEQLMANFQFVVSVALDCDKKNRCILCTGSLIKSDEVLLAAHCFCNEKGALVDPKKDVYVYFNSTTVHRGQRVQGYFGKMKSNFNCLHMRTNITYYYANIDLATVRLEENITDIEPVTLQQEEIAREIGRSVVTIGFGLDEFNQSVNLNLGRRAIRDCDPTRYYPMINGIYCLDGNSGARMDVGDSGGPLLMPSFANYYAYVQIGVAQGGLDVSTERCGNNGERVVHLDEVRSYTKVASNYNWIMFDDSSYFNIDVRRRKANRKRRMRFCCTS